MDKRTKGCLLIGLGVAIAGAMVVVALVAGAGYWAYQNFAPETTAVDPAKAEVEIAAIRAKFPGEPLITHDQDGRPQLKTDGRAGTFTGELQALRIAAYDKRAGKLIRLSVPFWLLRLAPDGKVSVGDDDVLGGVRAVERLTVKELETLGPGLLVDEQKPDGDRVLVWTE